jgi:hypothetical protein
MSDRFTSKFCPLKVNRSETDTTCVADGTKPGSRKRCSAEVKAAALVAADYYRKNPSRGIVRACEEGGVWPDQVAGYRGYFDNAQHILDTALGTIFKRRSGTDPGEVSVTVTTPDAAVSVVVKSVKEDVVGHLKLSELEGLFVDLKAQVDMVAKVITIRKKEEKKSAEIIIKATKDVEKAIAVLCSYGMDAKLVIATK